MSNGIDTNKASDRRRYRRLDHIFPVEFRLVNAQGEFFPKWYEAFTQDISSGGICLVVNHLTLEDIKLLEDKALLMSMVVNIPLGSKGIEALARVAWIKKSEGQEIEQYILGVSYEKIERSDNNRILRYAAFRRFFRIFSFTFSVILSAGLILAGVYNTTLRYENELLLKNLSDNQSYQQQLIKNGAQLKLQIEEMKNLLSESDKKIELFQKTLKDVSKDDQAKITALQKSIELLKKYQEDARKSLRNLMTKKAVMETDVKSAAQKVSLLEEKILSKLHGWLASHQNNHTGLVASFEGDEDIVDWAFTYDQALAAMVFVNSGDTENARKIFDFYIKAKKMNKGAFANAYYASTGEPSEYVAHAGPNIWLGLAILQYVNETKDKGYLSIALDIARWLEVIKDSEGGLKGGEEFSWYSTEHNLDAYAFYIMLYQITGEDVYKIRSEEESQWLNKNAYSKISSPTINRGKGDATIATDTYAWSVTAIGPAALKDVGMDPDAIMDFALKNCSVSVKYEKNDGSLDTVKGFDFAKYQNLARGGVVSCEWTAQMILAFKIMANYYDGKGDNEKAQYYFAFANDYISQLSKMIITSPSPVGQGDFCLPYASQELVETGHGWRTPKGNKTGSVAGTAYTILAIEGFNPLRLRDKTLNTKL